MSKKNLIIGAIFAASFAGIGTSYALQVFASCDNGDYIVDAAGNTVCLPPQEKQTKPAAKPAPVKQTEKKPVQKQQPVQKQPKKTIVEKKERLYTDWGPYKQKSPQELLAIIKSLLQEQAPVASYPQNAPVGCCYGKLVKPPTYKEIIIKYIAKDGGYKIVVKPPKFKVVEKKIVVVPGHYEYKAIQPKYEQKVETVKLPPQTKWVYENGIYCKVPVEFPALELKREVLVQPGKCEKVWVKPVIKTIKVKVLEQNATCVKEYQPPKYGIAKQSFMVKGPQVIWDAVLCDVNLKPNEIKQIQARLKELGYYKGPINGKLDDATLAAVVKFQVDHNLPAGNISIETLEAMGLKKLAQNYIACEVKNLK